MQLLREAGLPDGVINLVYGSGATIGDAALASPELAGIHFTGSTPVFQSMWKTVGENISNYRNYPRIVGETGGKDFILAHPSADVDERRDGDRPRLLRVPGPEVLGRLARLRAEEPVAGAEGAPRRAGRDAARWATSADFSNFMGAVIDSSSFKTQKDAIDEARASGKAEIVVGGDVRRQRGLLRRARR